MLGKKAGLYIGACTPGCRVTPNLPSKADTVDIIGTKSVACPYSEPLSLRTKPVFIKGINQQLAERDF